MYVNGKMLFTIRDEPVKIIWRRENAEYANFKSPILGRKFIDTQKRILLIKNYKQEDYYVCRQKDSYLADGTIIYEECFCSDSEYKY